ncbi:Probable metabolite transport protein C1271.09 [Cyberlindnera jadinii]|uniref:Probable metabolite transport protein C1271.09 n=1 Tax=Cyberlindnera jadinii (strain ATCC 18201 / CBS 1600 / BCRC 20928 / JCM 3617 / NBRC 0987 / NRRL Y-1542) TaxID=983966 RepID=A0A0H5C8J6_CYBJN|nr:Probable metabolite transport protein C1271.09 [Cyberlindnera jadinii]
MVLLWICTPDHLTPVWRVTLGIGAIPPISLFILRLYYTEGETFKKTQFKKVRIPYWAVIKFYWFRLTIVSLIWFIYDYSSYGFGLFSSYVLAGVYDDSNLYEFYWFRLIVVALIWFIYDYSAYGFGLFSSYVLAGVYDDSNLYEVFGWNVVLNLFYLPGSFLGAISADYIGPRLTLALGFGPGDNIGLLASKTSCTPIRGQYYGIAAAIGKVGAFTGTYVFTPLVNKHGIKSAWWLASSLGLLSCALTIFCLPPVDQAAMQNEDEAFLEYLASTGFDISKLGNSDEESVDEMNVGDSIGKDHEKVTATSIH